MNETTAIYRVIRQVGGQAELTRLLGLSSRHRSTVRWWLVKGYVPARWIRRVSAVSGVSVDDLLADWPVQSPKNRHVA